MHTVVRGRKTFRLAAPAHAPRLYVDFVDGTPQAAPDIKCPGNGEYGCDGVGCFGYVPFDAAAVDLRRYPRVADVPTVEATLDAGDALVLPAFWFHFIVHHPLEGGGRCVTLSFTNQSSGMPSMRPLAADVAEYRPGRES